MAHIDSLTAVKYTSLAYSTHDSDRPASASASWWQRMFETAADVTLVGSIREFPGLGTPANIVNVPVYGQSTSSQVGGQSDAPTLEFTLNYSPADHAALDTNRRNNTELAWRVRLSDVSGHQSVSHGEPSDDTQEYDDFYFLGTIQSFEITPSLSDAMQATFSVSINGEFDGPYSEVGGTYGGL